MGVADVHGLGFAKGFRFGGLIVFLFGRSLDRGGNGGGVTLSRQVVGTIGTVLLWTCRLRLLSSEFCRTKGWMSCCLLFIRACRKFLKLCPVRLLRDLGNALRKPVFGGGEIFSCTVLFRDERRGVTGRGASG